MKIIINTSDYGTSEGLADQITLPNGKYMYTGINSYASHIAKKNGLECKSVRYFGACIYANINGRAHGKFPIQIDEVSVADFIDKIATEDDCKAFHKNY